jgi:hypothetical protein
VTWHTAWDVNPPGPDDAQWPEYLAALPAEVERLQQLYSETPPAPPLAALEGVDVPVVPLDEQRKLAETLAEAVRTIDTLAEALDAALAYITRYVVCPSPHEPVAVVLWVAHAWAIDAAESSPHLAVTSVHPRSGKTRLGETVEQLVPRPWRAITPSEAVMFRKLEQDHPTLLLDEVDALFGTKRQADSYEGLRAIVNAGNRRGTTVPRMVARARGCACRTSRPSAPRCSWASVSCRPPSPTAVSRSGSSAAPAPSP